MPPSAKQVWERRQIGWIVAYTECLLHHREVCMFSLTHYYSGEWI